MKMRIPGTVTSTSSTILYLAVLGAVILAGWAIVDRLRGEADQRLRALGSK